MGSPKKWTLTLYSRYHIKIKEEKNRIIPCVYWTHKVMFILEKETYRKCGLSPLHR